MFFVVIFLLTPVGYGWSYRGWGPPYPSYVQRRRARAAADSSQFNHESWGWGGDLLWVLFVISLIWAFMPLYWH